MNVKTYFQMDHSCFVSLMVVYRGGWSAIVCPWLPCVLLVEIVIEHKVDMAPVWHQGGSKQAVYIRQLHPDLNKDGGWYNLPHVWDNIIQSCDL